MNIEQIYDTKGVYFFAKEVGNLKILTDEQKNEKNKIDTR